MVVTALALVLVGHAQAAELAFGAATQDPVSGVAAVPVILTADSQEQVSGIQFNIRLAQDGPRFSEIVAGPAARAAEKGAHWNALSSREATTIIAGLNQKRIGNGVVAECRFTAGSDPGAILDAVSLAKITLSDPYGSRVPLSETATPLTMGSASAAARASSAGQGILPADVDTPSSSGVWIACIVLCLAAFALLLRRRTRHSR